MSPEQGTIVATSVHRTCRDSARRWRRHCLRRGALALLEPGFASCSLHAAERRLSASRYPHAPGVSPTVPKVGDNATMWMPSRY
eukprot:COSAG06_NODE_135_length_22418_cov_9.162104_8_plen_84_part_00